MKRHRHVWVEKFGAWCRRCTRAAMYQCACSEGAPPNPQPKWDDLPWAPPLWKQQQGDPSDLHEALRVELVKARCPSGPWPFQ